MSLTAVIPTSGRSTLLERTLTALLPQMPDDGEVIVVVDGADRDTMQIVGRLARSSPRSLIALSQPQAGQAAARNRGLTAARGQVVLMLDDDIVADPGMVEAHLMHHRDRERRVVIGPLPVERIEPEPAHHRLIREWWDDELRLMARPTHRFTFRDFVTGNVSVSREMLANTGGFDTAFTGYGREDYELGARLLAAGAEFVFEPAASALHLYRKAVRDWLHQFESMGRADVYFARKHPALFEEIMRLASSPPMPKPSHITAMLERVVERQNLRGGRLWWYSANFVMRTWYWVGIRSAVESPREYECIAETCRRMHGWKWLRTQGGR